MATPRIPTKAQLLATQYEEQKAKGNLINPEDRPSWHDRAPVKAPPRRVDDHPKIQEGGVTEVGRQAYEVTQAQAPYADGGGVTPPTPEAYGDDAFRVSLVGEVSLPEAVTKSPTFQAAGSQEVIDKRAVVMAAKLAYLLEKTSDETNRRCRQALGNPLVGVFTWGHLPDQVRKELLEVSTRILRSKPWLFQVTRLLLALRGDVTVPHLFKSVCSLAAFHAVLSYADIVSSTGHLELSSVGADTPEEEAQVAANEAEAKTEDAALENLLDTIEADTGVDLSDPKWGDDLEETPAEKATRLEKLENIRTPQVEAKGMTTEAQQNDADGEVRVMVGGKPWKAIDDMTDTELDEFLSDDGA